MSKTFKILQTSEQTSCQPFLHPAVTEAQSKPPTSSAVGFPNGAAAVACKKAPSEAEQAVPLSPCPGLQRGPRAGDTSRAGDTFCITANLNLLYPRGSPSHQDVSSHTLSLKTGTQDTSPIQETRIMRLWQTQRY